MSASTKIFVNGSTPQCEDGDLNGFIAENNNLILGSGQALNTADNQQTNKAVSVYAGGGDFYTDSGSATAYVLSTIGARVAPPVYSDGQRIRFIVNATNTGAATVNAGAVGAVNLFLNGAAMAADTLIAGAYAEAVYGSGRFNVTFSTGTLKLSEKLYVGGKELYAPTEVADYVTAQNTTTHETGANPVAAFDLNASLTAGVFESFGPTGSGADNEWPVLDVVPSAAKKIRLRCRFSSLGYGVATNYDLLKQILAREFGSVSASNAQIVGEVHTRGYTSSTSASYGVKDADVVEFTVPLDAVRFELRHNDTVNSESGSPTFVSTAGIYLLGWEE